MSTCCVRWIFDPASSRQKEKMRDSVCRTFEILKQILRILMSELSVGLSAIVMICWENKYNQYKLFHFLWRVNEAAIFRVQTHFKAESLPSLNEHYWEKGAKEPHDPNTAINIWKSPAIAILNTTCHWLISSWKLLFGCSGFLSLYSLF